MIVYWIISSRMCVFHIRLSLCVQLKSGHFYVARLTDFDAYLAYAALRYGSEKDWPPVPSQIFLPFFGYSWWRTTERDRPGVSGGVKRRADVV